MWQEEEEEVGAWEEVGGKGVGEKKKMNGKRERGRRWRVGRGSAIDMGRKIVGMEVGGMKKRKRERE